MKHFLRLLLISILVSSYPIFSHAGIEDISSGSVSGVSVFDVSSATNATFTNPYTASFSVASPTITVSTATVGIAIQIVATSPTVSTDGPLTDCIVTIEASISGADTATGAVDRLSVARLVPDENGKYTAYIKREGLTFLRPDSGVVRWLRFRFGFADYSGTTNHFSHNEYRVFVRAK